MKLKVTLLILPALILILFQNCSSSDSDYYEEDTYAETKMTLEEQENMDPLAFLSTDGTYKKNLLGEWVLNGTVSNYATIAEYQDVVLEVYFYSKTESLIGKEYHTVYDFFPAGKSRSFKIKTFGYKGTKSIGWDIIDASVAY